MSRFKYIVSPRSWMILFSLFVGLSNAYARPINTSVNSETVEAWADGSFTKKVKGGQVSGAVVSVVKDGEIIFEKGYGFGNVITKTAADPLSTRVRIGSTTKTFTATIIGQLIDEDIISSLDDPANKYLKRYKLPENEGTAITLRHLLTHTAGFADKFYFIGSDRKVDVPVSAEFFDKLRPKFSRPAGEAIVYSNFGVATLGLVIEDLLGIPIEEAMETRIFDPIGMTQTSLLMDIDKPSELAEPGRLSADGLVDATPFTAINPAVAQTGSIVSTARDMARYMNAHLGYDSIFGDALQTRLQTRIETNAPEINGLGMVFFVDKWAEKKTVSHGGNWAGFHTWMTLVPEENLGVYVTLLGDVAPQTMMERFITAAFPKFAKPASPALLSARSISDEFLVAFFGSKRPIREWAKSNQENLDQYVGLYRTDRRAFKSIEALLSLVYFNGGTLEISKKTDGLYLGGAGPWVSQGAGKFILDVPTRPMIVIQPNSRTGEMTLSPDIGIYTFTKIPAWTDPKWQAIAIHILIPLTLLGLLSPILFGFRLRVLGPTLIGVSGAILIGSAVAGLGMEDTMMTGYFAGYTARLQFFSLGANILLLSCFITLAIAIMRSTSIKEKAWDWFVALLALSNVAILAQYDALGFHVP